MVSFAQLVAAMMEDVAHSEFSGFDVEVRVKYDQDEEGANHLYITDDPLIKFSVVKHGKQVTMQPYFYNGEAEDDLGV